MATGTNNIMDSLRSVEAYESRIAANEVAVATNTSNISTNTTNVSTNTTNISTNATEIAKVGTNTEFGRIKIAASGDTLYISTDGQDAIR